MTKNPFGSGSSLATQKALERALDTANRSGIRHAADIAKAKAAYGDRLVTILGELPTDLRKTLCEKLADGASATQLRSLAMHEGWIMPAGEDVAAAGKAAPPREPRSPAAELPQ
ncbi:hypothetical protein V8J36_21900 [Frigidibacter sp. MR17.14]|uniref:hypothetical protein n=1 Tax=Frigidibacter sp. MR17.14 TaxID=3126509 RepID=UPI003012F40D